MYSTGAKYYQHAVAHMLKNIWTYHFISAIYYSKISFFSIFPPVGLMYDRTLDQNMLL